MLKRFLIIMILLSLTACGGARYNWNPQSDGAGPPRVLYEGTGIEDPNSNL